MTGPDTPGGNRPRILAMDTATFGCSAAVRAGNITLAEQFETMARGQSEALVPMIEAALAACGTEPADLDAIAVTIGPGAFTGLRIGLAAARGMALALGVPCLGVTTTEAVAEGAIGSEAEGGLVVALDSKRDDLFVQCFGTGRVVLGAPEAIAPNRLAERVSALAVGAGPTVIGDAAKTAAALLNEAGTSCVLGRSKGIPIASNVAAIASRRWRAGENPPPPAPLYLRPPDAVVPKYGGRLRP